MSHVAFEIRLQLDDRSSQYFYNLTSGWRQTSWQRSGCRGVTLMTLLAGTRNRTSETAILSEALTDAAAVAREQLMEAYCSTVRGSAVAT
jgi:hypothetical protein